MARKPKSLDVFHKYVGDTLQVVKGESAQACVLILSATLEQALMTLLGSFLMECTTADEMFKPNGELESFFKCTRMAYCLGFIPDAVRKNLETIGKIRNRFAHETIMIDFSDKEVSDHCKTLTLPKQSFLTSTVTEHEFENDL